MKAIVGTKKSLMESIQDSMMKRVALYSRYRCYKKYNIDWFLEKEEFLDYKGRREYNNKISEIIKLRFDLDDIKYIIVK